MLSNQGFILVASLGAILLSMTLHEAMHAFASYWLGDDTAKLQGRLTLNPLKHIDPFLTVLLPLILALAHAPIFGAARPVPFNPHRVRHGEYGAALVGLAGPLTNLVLALLGAGLFRLFLPDIGSVFFAILIIFIEVNIGFFVFNMIPFPPLDGSRVLYAFAPEPVQEIMARIEGLGLLGLALFIFVLFPFISPLIGNVFNYLLRALVGVSI